MLVDVGMPGKSGYEVAAYVKQSPRLAHIPGGAPDRRVRTCRRGPGHRGGMRRRAGQAVRAAAGHRPRQGASRTRSGRGRSISRAAAGGRRARPRPAPWRRRPTTAGSSRRLLRPARRGVREPVREAGAAGRHPSAPAELDWFGLKHGSSASMAEPELALDHAEPARRTRMAPAAVPPPPARSCSAGLRVAARCSNVAARPGARPPRPRAQPGAASRPSPAAPEIRCDAGQAFAARLSLRRPVLRPPARPSAAARDRRHRRPRGADIAHACCEQLTDRVVRETVAEIAERLIREEIERIKASIP